MSEGENRTKVVEGQVNEIVLKIDLNGYPDQEIEAYVRRMLEHMGCSIETFLTQNLKYGFSWRDDGLGPRSLFADATSKQSRLKRLLWETPPDEFDGPKIFETLRDRIVYDLLTMLKYEHEHGMVPEPDIRREVNKT